MVVSCARLREVRELIGLSRAGVYRLTGIGAHTQYDIESGRVMPHASTLGRIAGALCVPVSALITVDGAPLCPDVLEARDWSSSGRYELRFDNKKMLEAMARSGITNYFKAGRHIGVSKGIISTWSAGYCTPSACHLVGLARLLDVSVDDLYSRVPAAQPLPAGKRETSCTR